jgi:hypothetical protein
MRVPHKVSDHHWVINISNKLPWLPREVHQLLTPLCLKICTLYSAPNLRQNYHTNICLLSFCDISGNNRKNISHHSGDTAGQPKDQENYAWPSGMSWLCASKIQSIHLFIETTELTHERRSVSDVVELCSTFKKEPLAHPTKLSCNLY